jgi:rhodanese-related sulfurtransferase
MLMHMLGYEISPAELRDLLDAGGDEKPVLLDVREPWENEEARIEGSLLIPLGQLQSRASGELDPEAHIVAICHHGQRSMSATAWLRDEGYERVQSLRGGIDAWSAEVDSTVPRY